MLASTRSSASRSISSFGPYSGERGRAMRPVLVDSRMPKGAISFMNESILDGLADLRRISTWTWPGYFDLHLDNAVVRADIEYFSTELMRQMRDSCEMLMLMSQSLTCC